YDRDHGLRSRNRPWSANDNPNRSSFAAQGLFSLDGSFLPGPTTLTFNQANQVENYVSANVHGYNRNYDRYLSLPVERYQAAAIANYEFSDSITAY
ncbi:hypothetical protein U2088_15360, partial [Listeria monocytogenes]|uniref:hypothetical protein n=1 Tax=Listeria monocytogenes TaxID=1639 RepID=UPI002FDC79A5